MKDKGVCLLNDSFPPLIDGVANTVVNYGRVLAEDGARPYVITPKNPDADDSAYPYPVIRYSGIDTREKLGYVAGNPFSIRTAQRLKNENINVIHSHCPFASGVMARSLREIIPAPLIFTYHTKFDFDIYKMVKNRLVQDSAIKLVESNIKACDEVWVVSRGAGENMREIFGYEGDYIVMDNGVDIPRGRMSKEKYMRLTSDVAIPEGVPIFLFVGRMMWYKNIKLILQGLEGIHSQGKDFRMIFIGGGADLDDIKALTEQLGLSRKVIFCGRISDREKIRAWYCRANLMIFPSTYDTNGLVVREAAACSLPSVLVAGSCASEGTTGDHNSFIISENPASLAALLMRIMDRLPFVADVGENAAKEIYISWTDAVRKAEERYEVVIDNYWSGKYKTKNSLSRQFINFSADIIDTLGSIYNVVKNLQHDDDKI